MKTTLLSMPENHRSFRAFILHLILILAVSSVFYSSSFSQCTTDLGSAGLTMDPDDILKFENLLPIPARIDATVGGNFEMVMQETEQDLLGVTATGIHMTTVWGYGTMNGLYPASYPGPTFEAMRDVPITATFHNQLPGHFLPVDPSLHMAHPDFVHGPNAVATWYSQGNVPTVPHLHGGHTESASDGLPEAWYTQDFEDVGAQYVKQKLTYHNDQEAATLWYHDHALGITRLNVYAGLAGFYLLRDDHENFLTSTNVLPSGPYEIEIVIQDRLFDPNGQLFWPAYPGETPYEDFIVVEGADLPLEIFPEGGPTALAEFFGNVILVNGKAWPKLEVEPRKYRFRLLNGSDSRFYILELNNGAQILQIGTDDALIETPVLLNELVIAPGERYDIVVDFSGYDPANGTAITMTNIGPDEPYGGGIPGDDFDVACPDNTGKIMQFVVNQPLSNLPDASVGIGTNLRAPVQALVPTAGVPIRKLVLFEGTDEFGRLQPMLGTMQEGSKTWFEPITENPMLNSIEEWEVYNATGDAHPIHLHLVAFQIKNRESFVGNVEPKPQVQHSSAEGDPTDPLVEPTYGEGGILTVENLVGDATGPLPHELGWKDTFIVPPGTVGRVVAKFDRPGRYVWHCHILSHEDHEMMRPFFVGDMPRMAGQFRKEGYNLDDPTPNPVVNGSTTEIEFTIPDRLPVAYRIYDGAGFVLMSGDTRFYDSGTHTIIVNTNDLPGVGQYVFTIYAGEFYDFTRIKVK